MCVKMTGVVGRSLSEMDATVLKCITEMRHTASTDVKTFLINWNKGYRVHQLALRRKLNEESLQEVSTRETSSASLRPSRTARLTAIENMKKQAAEEEKFLKPNAMPRTKAKKKVKESKKEEITPVEEKEVEIKTEVIFKEPKIILHKLKSPVKEQQQKIENPENVMAADPGPEMAIEQESQPERKKPIIDKKVSLSISPVPYPTGTNPTIINESINESPDIENNQNISNEEPKRKKRKGKKGTITSELIFDETIHKEADVGLDKTMTIINTSIYQQNNPDNSFKPFKAKRTKTKKTISTTPLEEFLPVAESSILNKTRNLTPKNVNNGTFLVNLPDSSPVDIFAEGLETVVRNKKPPREDNETEFQAPLPVPPKKETKPEEVNYDAMGNVINRTECGRTKIVSASRFEFLPDAADGRPVRTRTKVRRLGVDVENVQPASIEHSNINETTQRSKRTRKRETNKSSENEPIKKAKTIMMKTKALRASLVSNKGISKLPLSSAKKYKTPLSNLTNKRPMIMINSSTKDYPQSLQKNRADEAAKVILKQSEDQLSDEREAKIKSKLQKEEIAALKKQEELQRRQELLKQRNKEKLARAKECRAKIEEEKHEMILQSEKEKEMKRKVLMQQRADQLKVEKNKRKMLTEKKLAENEERRRAEEEIRLAKIREIELEQQRQQQEKQRQLELEEKRARERLEEKNKMIEAEKLLKQKMAHAAKIEAELNQKQKQYDGMYLPRNENDYGLEDELSENSDDEEADAPRRPSPKWVQAAKKGNPLMKYLTKEQLNLFIPMRCKSPNVTSMFNLSPKRVHRRTSSAIWNATILPSPS